VAVGCLWVQRWGRGVVGDGDRDGDRMTWQPPIITFCSPSQGPAGPRGLPGPPGAPVSISPSSFSSSSSSSSSVGDKEPYGVVGGLVGRDRVRAGPTLPDGNGNTWGHVSLCHHAGGECRCHQGLQAQSSHFLTNFFPFFFLFPHQPPGSSRFPRSPW